MINPFRGRETITVPEGTLVRTEAGTYRPRLTRTVKITAAPDGNLSPLVLPVVTWRTQWGQEHHVQVTPELARAAGLHLDLDAPRKAVSAARWRAPR